MKSDYDLFVDLCKRQNLKDDYANYFKGVSHNLAMKKLKSLKKKIEKNKDFILLENLMHHDDDRVRLNAAFFDVLEHGFSKFLEENKENYQKAEYLLPTIIGGMVKKGTIEVRVLKSHDQWFGVTYREDKPYVVESIKKLLEEGEYPKKLFCDN